jgi:drug/metabolite transporter (DMT)-like permease
MTDTLKKGIVYMLIASLSFAFGGAITRILGTSLPTVELVFFRNIVGVIFVLGTLTKKPLVQTGGNIKLLVFRGIIGTLALYTFFYGITKIGLAEAITYQQAYPILLAVLMTYFYKERLNFFEILAIICGFVGIGLIFIPQMKNGFLHTQSHIIGLINMTFTALAYLSINGLSKYYDNRAIVLSFMISGILLPIFSMAIGQFYIPFGLEVFFAKFVIPDLSQLPYLAMLGISALIGQKYLTMAFTSAKSGPISVVGYSNILFSILFGIFLGDGLPSLSSSFGILMIIISGVLITKK